MQTPKVPTVNIPKRELTDERVEKGEGKREDEVSERKVLESHLPGNAQTQSSPPGTVQMIQPPSPFIHEPLIAFED